MFLELHHQIFELDVALGVFWNVSCCHTPTFSLSPSLFAEQTEIGSSNRVSFFERPPGGTVGLERAAADVYMFLLQRRKPYQALLLLLCFSHFCPFCFIPLPHHHILLCNCRPISGAEWPSRHQQLRLWSKCINVNMPHLSMCLMFLMLLVFTV